MEFKSNYKQQKGEEKINNNHTLKFIQNKRKMYCICVHLKSTACIAFIGIINSFGPPILIKLQFFVFLFYTKNSPNKMTSLF